MEMMLAKLLLLVLSLLPFCSLMVQLHASTRAFSPADNYLLSCGSSQNTSFEGTIFVPDTQQTYFTMKSEGDSVVTISNSTVPSIYQSLRSFTKLSSYEFSIQRQGRHWIRLYFHPLPNSGHDLNSAPITAITDNFVLINKFTFNKQKNPYLFKEYMINVTNNKLTIYFIPSNNSVAFVNGIEVVSVPDDLIPDRAELVASPSPRFASLSNRALETAFRLNVGGPLITPWNDTLRRTWENDQEYLHVNGSIVNVSVDPRTIRYQGGVTSETAPPFIYATAEAIDIGNASNFNITWTFPVNPSYVYFVRLHFCDIFPKVLFQPSFDVFVNSDTAILRLFLSSVTSGSTGHSPYYRDFISSSSAGSNCLSVSIGPDKLSSEASAILNGLEIMKISNDVGSLDGKFSVENLLPALHSKKNKLRIIIGVIVGASATLGMIVVCHRLFVVHRFKSKAGVKPHEHRNSLASLNLGRVFTFQEIKDSTNEFSESLLLGVGGFGKVYKGMLEDGTCVAIKRADAGSGQGHVEFQNELETVSKLHHFHLVSLIGYCNEQSEMILVYQYMANGTLRSHLYGTNLPSLTWKQRLEICLGAARGLHYLHTGAAQSIIHRDVKTSNILLDENFVAKLADFGISKIISDWDQSHVTTAVKGSFGYLDPEYFRSQQLTKKSDVYSFGVVLMEVLCGKPALNLELPTEEANLAEWALSWTKKGMTENVTDPSLVGRIDQASLRMFVDLAEKCLAEQGVNRPTMGDVVWNLEYLLQLEKSMMVPIVEEKSTDRIAEFPSVVPLMTFVSDRTAI